MAAAFQEKSLQGALLRRVFPSLSFDFVLEIREGGSRTVSEMRMRREFFCTRTVEGTSRRMISGFKVGLMTGILLWMVAAKKSYSRESKDTQNT